MQHLWLTAWTDILESLRAKWFAVYALVFGSLVVLLFVLGLTESRVMGFTGLSRLMLTYIQLSMAILPIFVLITTVRSLAGDREAGVFEYLLALPVPLGAWYWGKLAGRFLMVFTPVFLAMVGALAWGYASGAEIPWKLFAYYTGLLVALSWCFLGIGILISSLARSVDVAQGAAFLVWLVLLLFLDLILLGVMIQQQIPAESAVAIALANPMQVFRTGTMLLFDPQLVMLGPAAYVILDNFGTVGYMVFALAYPTVVGTLAAMLGYWVFRRGDLLMNPLANSHRPGVVPRSRLLPLVSIGLLGVLAYTVGTHWPVRPVYDAAAPADCDLARGPCTAVFPDGASIRLAFDADRLTPLHPLPASVTVDGTDADAAHIEFSGIDMNMGLVTQELDRIGDGEFAGQVTLPVCVRGSMKWRAYVTAAAGAHYRALFVFETRR